jgi:hypothetical protein
MLLRTNPAYRISGPGSWEEVFNATFVDNPMRKFAGYGRQPGRSAFREAPEHAMVD